MRRLVLPLGLAAALALAAPSSSQAHLADSSGVYLSLGTISSSGYGGSLGYRQSDGLDYGVYLGVSQFTRASEINGQTYAGFQVGPQAGYTALLGRGVQGRISSQVLYGSGGYTRNGGTVSTDTAPRSVSYQALTGNLTATVSRSVRLVGSLRVRPTVGVYAEGRQLLSYQTDQTPDLELSRTRLGMGVHVGLPLSVRVLGQDVALSPFMQIPVTGEFPVGGTYAGGGLRINF